MVTTPQVSCRPCTCLPWAKFFIHLHFTYLMKICKAPLKLKLTIVFPHKTHWYFFFWTFHSKVKVYKAKSNSGRYSRIDRFEIRKYGILVFSVLWSTYIATYVWRFKILLEKTPCNKFCNLWFILSWNN